MNFSKPTFVEESTIELVQSSMSDDMVAMAAWVSFNKADEARLDDRERVAGLINFLMKNRHMSPFEHGQITVFIKAPIGVVREWHRHRTQSYNEQSGRYTIFEGEFYLPPVDRPMIQEGKTGAYKFVKAEEWKAKIVRGIITQATSASWRAYEFLIGFGIAKEVARWVLPVNLMTKYYATMNPRNLMQFLDLRTDPQALEEIRLLAGQLEEIFAKEMPLTYAAWKSTKETA